MPFFLVRDDIVCVNAEAVVNAANSGLKMGGGVCGRIFREAGARQLQEACDAIGYCAPGDAVLTSGFHLPKAKWILHTVGPIWQGGEKGEREILRSCYLNTLRLAESHGIESVAFPLISAGIYGYPKDEALHIATETIREFLREESVNDPTVYLVLFENKTVSMAEKAFPGSIEKHINDDAPAIQAARMERSCRQITGEVAPLRNVPVVDDRSCFALPLCAVEATERPVCKDLEEKDKQEIIRAVYDGIKREETFRDTLFRMIDDRGLTDTDVYKNANLDRRVFSKIRGSLKHHPKRETVLAFVLSLRLNENEAAELMASAGMAFMPSSMTDQIVLMCIRRSHFNIFDVNEILFTLELTQLGSAC